MRNSEYMLRAGRRERASVDGRCWHGHAKHPRIARGGRHWRNSLCAAGAAISSRGCTASWPATSGESCKQPCVIGGTAAAALPSQRPHRQQLTARARTSAGKCRTSACCPCALPPWRPQLLATAVAGRGTRGRRQRRQCRCASPAAARRGGCTAPGAAPSEERWCLQRVSEGCRSAGRALREGVNTGVAGKAQKHCHSAPSDLDQCEQLRGGGSSGSALVGRLQQPSGPLTRLWTLGAQGIGPWVARRLLLGRQAAQRWPPEFSASASLAPGPKRPSVARKHRIALRTAFTQFRHCAAVSRRCLRPSRLPAHSPLPWQRNGARAGAAAHAAGGGGRLSPAASR